METSYLSRDYQHTVLERFLQYVRIDTQSDPASSSVPSTEKQKDLAVLLVRELIQMGVADAELDPNGYVYATIPSNVSHECPVICFCAHMDTSPDCSGAGVKPLVHENYDGSPIILPDDPGQVIRREEHPYLEQRLGDTLVTASGTTLLGADNKSGVAVIMDAVNGWMNNPAWPHGTIRILFTPDEEIGRGVDHVDLARLGARVAYTLDGGERGSLEDETFSADGMTIRFLGVGTHPGDAKGKMVSALKVAADFITRLPKDHRSPETTADRQGFVHPVSIRGSVEESVVDFIIRDFDTRQLQVYEEQLKTLALESVRAFPGSRVEFDIREQYRNMKEILRDLPHIVQYAEEAMTRTGTRVRRSQARGGTDGSRLSFMGLPCPNLFTGEMAFHGKHEYVSAQDMRKSVDMVVELAAIWAEKSRSASRESL